jgi:hypothetical protein
MAYYRTWSTPTERITVINPKGWHLVTATSVTPIVTIADLVTVTNLSRRTIREMLTHYQISPLLRYSPRDTLRYQRQHILAAIESMTGSGNRRSTRP